MDASTRMNDLADVLKGHVNEMTALLQAQESGTVGRDPSDLPMSFRNSKYEALQAIQELQTLIRGPLESIMTQAQPEFLPLQLVHDFELAKAVPLAQGAQTTYRDVADKTGLPEKDVRCILRSAMLDQVFDESSDGFIVHTPGSRLLAEDLQLRAWLDFMLSHHIPSQTKLTEAMKNYPQSSNPAQSGFAISHENQSLFGYLKSNPETAKVFSFGINALSRLGGIEVFHLTDNLPAGICSPGHKWVDVGGGDGQVMIELARRFPGVHCIVQDLPHAVASRTARQEDGPVTFMAHDFFEPQTIVDADTYLLRNVLHNWNDADCVRILTRIVEAMKPSATIIINDRILPEKDEIHATMERKLRFMDLYMRALLNSHGREIGDWTDLLSTPSLGLQVEEVIRPRFSDLAILVLRKSLKTDDQQGGA